MAEFIGRVDQLDSIELDDELSHHFITQLKKLLELLPYSVSVKIGAELEAALEFVLYYWTLGQIQGSVGQNLLGLELKDNVSKIKVISFILANIIPKYLASKATTLPNWSVFHHLDKLQLVVTGLKIANFAIFLKEGKYPTLLRRIFGLGLKRVGHYEGRNVSYYYMHKELLWQSTMELLLFVIPWINFHRLKGFFSKAGKVEAIKSAKDAKTQKNICTFCHQDVIVASRGVCAHIFCYFCLASNVEADASFACPQCGVHLDSVSSIS